MSAQLQEELLNKSGIEIKPIHSNFISRLFSNKKIIIVFIIILILSLALGLGLGLGLKSGSKKESRQSTNMNNQVKSDDNMKISLEEFKLPDIDNNILKDAFLRTGIIKYSNTIPTSQNISTSTSKLVDNNIIFDSYSTINSNFELLLHTYFPFLKYKNINSFELKSLINKYSRNLKKYYKTTDNFSSLNDIINIVYNTLYNHDRKFPVNYIINSEFFRNVTDFFYLTKKYNIKYLYLISLYLLLLNKMEKNTYDYYFEDDLDNDIIYIYSSNRPLTNQELLSHKNDISVSDLNNTQNKDVIKYSLNNLINNYTSFKDEYVDNLSQNLYKSILAIYPYVNNAYDYDIVNILLLTDSNNLELNMISNEVFIEDIKINN